jgi:ABC-type polysaccharide/polyol phosphate transport system ATPase subunit
MQLGAGFDQELNAYDNILLYSTLRLSTYREAKESVNSILDFAELHEFANTPIKYYSSGMRARLGFAVALNCKPDLLILDEVLAVGDAHFRLKCKDAFAQLLAQSKTIIMASHSMQSIQQSCKNSIVLSKGAIVYQGASTDAIALYVDKSQKCSDLTT